MFLRRDTLGQHVIHIDLHVSPNLPSEYSIYQPLVRCSSIFQSKWHHFVAIQALIRGKRRLFLVCLVHPDLIVSVSASLLIGLFHDTPYWDWYVTGSLGLRGWQASGLPKVTSRASKGISLDLDS